MFAIPYPTITTIATTTNLPPLHPLPTSLLHHNLDPRQDASIFSSGSLFPTITESPTTTFLSSLPPGPTISSPVPPHEWLTTSKLQVATEPVPIAATQGLVMPNPAQEAYVEVQYTLGFVDAVKRPAPITGGWMRLITPLLIFPDYTVNVFPHSGADDPLDPKAIPPASDGLCGASAEDFSIGYPYVFHRPGWYMYVVNQTWLQPTIINNTCQLPIISQRSFFATQAISIRPLPTAGAYPAAPPAAYTVFAGVSPNLPGPLPLEEHRVTPSEKLGLGLGVTVGVLAFLACVGLFMWIRSRRKAKREIKAFNRLKPHEQYQFLLDNPNHFLNPDRPGRRAAYGGLDAWGRPMGWMDQRSRWGKSGGLAPTSNAAMGQMAPGWGMGMGHAGFPYTSGVPIGGFGGGDEMRQVYNAPVRGYGQAPPGYQGIGGPPPLPGKDPRMVWPVTMNPYG